MNPYLGFNTGDQWRPGFFSTVLLLWLNPRSALRRSEVLSDKTRPLLSLQGCNAHSVNFWLKGFNSDFSTFPQSWSRLERNQPILSNKFAVEGISTDATLPLKPLSATSKANGRHSMFHNHTRWSRNFTRRHSIGNDCNKIIILSLD